MAKRILSEDRLNMNRSKFNASIAHAKPATQDRYRRAYNEYHEQRKYAVVLQVKLVDAQDGSDRDRILLTRYTSKKTFTDKDLATIAEKDPGIQKLMKQYGVRASAIDARATYESATGHRVYHDR